MDTDTTHTSPWAKWESWTTSVVMSDDDARRYVDKFASFVEAITR